jgi:hypothetical protein
MTDFLNRITLEYKEWMNERKWCAVYQQLEITNICFYANTTTHNDFPMFDEFALDRQEMKILRLCFVCYKRIYFVLLYNDYGRVHF